MDSLDLQAFHARYAKERGLHRVQAEFKLVSLALNLRRMCALQEGWAQKKGESEASRTSGGR